MKKIASILLFVFVVFLITPPVVCVIENDSEITFACDFSDKEQPDKNIKLVFYHVQKDTRICLSYQESMAIFTNNSLKHDDVSLKIFITPPELI
jgi:hypothetical protein